MSEFQRSQQENAAVILRAQLDAARLVRLADEAANSGATVVTIAVEDARDMARRVSQASEIAERAHLGIYGLAREQNVWKAEPARRG